jgi:NAD(P)-dependent dehydrogenase (short-subunit alcohol dehydrogenase family)
MSQKTALIAGASGLLGKSLVNNLLDKDYIVIATDKNFKQLTLSSNEIEGGKLERLTNLEMDITSEASIREVLKEINKKSITCDVLINSAYPKNQSYGKDMNEVTYEAFCENLSTHVGGYYLTSKIFSEYFLKQGKGNVINVASIYGTMAPRFSIYKDTQINMPVEYAAIKSAIIQLTKYFAQYYKKENIRFNSVSPGGIFNSQPDNFVQKYMEFTGNIGLMEPDRICDVISFLSSDDSLGITGQNVIVDDGFSL